MAPMTLRTTMLLLLLLQQQVPTRANNSNIISKCNCTVNCKAYYQYPLHSVNAGRAVSPYELHSRNYMAFCIGHIVPLLASSTMEPQNTQVYRPAYDSHAF